MCLGIIIFVWLPIREDFIDCGKSPIEYTICKSFQILKIQAPNVLKTLLALLTSSPKCESYFYRLSMEYR